MNTRPHYRNAHEWLAHARYELARGREPWPPATVDELRLAEIELPDQLHRWRPDRATLRLLGLPPCFGRRVPPFSEVWRERLLRTLLDDGELRAAVCKLMEGTAA